MISFKTKLALVLPVILSTFGSWAANLPTRAVTDDPSEPLSIEEALSRASRGKKLQTALNIRKAFEALDAARYTRLPSILSTVKSDGLFADYYFGLTAEGALRTVRGKIRRKQWVAIESDLRRAREALLEIEARFPSSRFRKTFQEKMAWADLMEGDVLVVRKKWSEANQAYSRGLARISGEKILLYFNSRSAESFSKSCVKKVDPYCTAWLRKLVDFFPKQSPAGRALAENIPASFELNRVDKADRAYERLSSPYKAADPDVAMVDDAIHLYLTQEKGKAEDRLKEFLEQFPRSSVRARARYWLAQIRSKDGKQQKEDTKSLYEEVLRESPISFYGLLASLAMGRGLETLIESGSVPMASREEKALDAKEMIHFAKAEALFKAEAFDAAREELRDINPRAMLSSEFLVYLGALQHTVGNHVHFFQIVNELIQRKYEHVYSKFFIQRIFPVRFESEIEAQCKEQAVDPLMILSLMKQESGFNLDAVSASGALGLMQLMPLTATSLDESIELSEATEKSQNIRLGVKYIADLFKKYDGNWVYILAAYNAGPSRVDQWRKDARPEWGMLEFIESIPFRETREYVSSIIRGYVWYSYLTQGTKMLSLEYFWHPQGPHEPKPAGSKPDEAREYPPLIRRPAASQF